MLIIVGGPILAGTVNTNRDSTTPLVASDSSHITKQGHIAKQHTLHGLVPFHTILRSEFGHAHLGVTEINDPDTWSAFWQQNCSSFCQVSITDGSIVAPPMPQIDFTSETVIVASPGLEGSPGYQFNITKVVAVHHHLLVEATLTTPGLNCFWIQVVTFPIHIIEIPKTSLAPTLNMTRTQAPACPY
jgi:hypothetical protein